MATSHGVHSRKSPADRTSPVLPCMLTALGVSVCRMLLPSSSTACYCAVANLAMAGPRRCGTLCVVSCRSKARYDLHGLRDAVRDGRTGWLVREEEQLTDVVERAVKELAAPARR